MGPPRGGRMNPNHDHKAHKSERFFYQRRGIMGLHAIECCFLELLVEPTLRIAT
jgi:hypothetical protein